MRSARGAASPRRRAAARTPGRARRAATGRLLAASRQMARAHAVARVAVRRDLDGRRLELIPKAIAPSPAASQARAVRRARTSPASASGGRRPGRSARALRVRGRERLAAARVEHGEDRPVVPGASASASSVETAATSAPLPWASARAVATPIRRPGERARADPDADAAEVAAAQPGAASSALGERRAAARRGPAARPARGVAELVGLPAVVASATTVSGVAVSKPSSGLIARRPPAAGRRRGARAARARRRGARAGAAGDLGPLDERDAVGAELVVEQAGSSSPRPPRGGNRSRWDTGTRPSSYAGRS